MALPRRLPQGVPDAAQEREANPHRGGQAVPAEARRGPGRGIPGHVVRVAGQLAVARADRAEGAVMPTYQPMGNRVVVKREEREKQSEGGIIIPDAAQKSVGRGKVVAVSLNRTGGDAGAVNVGDVVAFNRFAGHDLEDGLVVLSDEDILAVVKE